jgi:hypothetical protein
VTLSWSDQTKGRETVHDKIDTVLDFFFVRASNESIIGVEDGIIVGVHHGAPCIPDHDVDYDVEQGW